MKIHEYQQVYKLLNDNSIEPNDKAVGFWSILKGEDFEEVRKKVPLNKLHNYMKKWKGIKPSPVFMWYRIGWKFYRLNLNPHSNTSEDTTNVIALAANEESLMENIHKIMATFTRRKNRSSEYYIELSEKIRQHVTINKALALAGFFLTSYEMERKRELMSLTKKMKKINRELEQMK